MNFGYNFGVPRSEQSQTNPEEITDSNESQNSEYSSIDFNKITQPTFKFGQYGQVSTENVSAAEANNGDDDSFLAEPSMSVGQFDASFNFESQPADPIFSPSNSADSLKSPSVKTSSTVSVPILVEEPLEQPFYLEEPIPHSVEELLKATVDGDTSALIPEFWGEIAEEKVAHFEEPTSNYVKKLLKTDVGLGGTAESWENIDEEEIRAAEAEFLKMEETVSNDVEPSAEGIEHNESVAEVSEDAQTSGSGPVADITAMIAVEESKAASKPDKMTKAPASSKAKASLKTATVTKTPAVSKAKSATKANAAPKTKAAVVQKEKITEVPIVLTEGRAKRERKTVERLADSVIQPTKTVTEKFPTIPSGTGMKLGDIEAINHVLGRKTGSDKVVMMLHKVLFNRVGESAHRKASIRAFCGDESANYETKLKKYTNAELKELAHFLGLTGANEKAAIVAKISNFLIKPKIESVKFTAKGDRIIKKVKKTNKPKPERSSKRINPGADKKPLGRPPKGSKPSTKPEYLTPETVDSDVESDVEREVLEELNNS